MEKTFGQDWRRHECNPIGQGTHLYSFSARIQGEDMQFWEEIGMQLFGVNGQQFWETFGSNVATADHTSIMKGVFGQSNS